eukprot:tig00020996_g16951.t1
MPAPSVSPPLASPPPPGAGTGVATGAPPRPAIGPGPPVPASVLHPPTGPSVLDAALLAQLARGVCPACGEESRLDSSTPLRALESGFLVQSGFGSLAHAPSVMMLTQEHVLLCLSECGELGKKLAEARKEAKDAVHLLRRGDSAAIAAMVDAELDAIIDRIDRFPQEHVIAVHRVTQLLRWTTTPTPPRTWNAGTADAGLAMARAVGKTIWNAKSGIERELEWLRAIPGAISPLEAAALGITIGMDRLRRLAVVPGPRLA